MSEAGPAPSRGRRLRARLLALTLSCGLALVLGELAVRLAVGAPPVERTPLLRVRANPLRGWEMVPGEAHYTYLHPVRVNALGLRGPELPAERGDELRVLALGDSLIYGQGVADDETVPRALERALVERDARERAWRVVNGGLRGYATNQELGLLRELGAAVDPDLVALFWYPNDLVDSDVQALARRLGESGPVAFDLDAPPEGRALLAWRGKQLLRRSALVMFLHDALRDWRARPPSERTVEEGLARLRDHLASFAALSAELGARPLVVVLPEAAALSRPPRDDGPAARALALARDQGLSAFTPEPALRALRERTGAAPVIPFDGHYDAAANAAIGAACATWILSLD